MMVELIQQHNDVPSVYREIIARRGYGFHHWAVGSDRFDETVADVIDWFAEEGRRAYGRVIPRGQKASVSS